MTLLEAIRSFPMLRYDQNLAIDVYNELRDKNLVKIECTPFEFYSAVSPQLLIKEGYSEHVVYVFNYILDARWIDYHNMVSKDNKFEFSHAKKHDLMLELFKDWMSTKERRFNNLFSRIKRVLIQNKIYNKDEFDRLYVEDIYVISPVTLYKCNGVGKKSLIRLQTYFESEGLDWFGFHKFKPSRKDYTDVGRGW